MHICRREAGKFALWRMRARLYGAGHDEISQRAAYTRLLSFSLNTDVSADFFKQRRRAGYPEAYTSALAT